MRRLKLHAPILLLFAAAPSFACRELVQFAAHLTGDSPEWMRFFHVVTILDVRSDRLVGRIDNTFGDRSFLGSTVDLPFISDEEPHAVCPVRYTVGTTFLVYSSNSVPPFTISRFNGYNIPQTHEKFATYVNDLEQASAANQRLERP
jgi:hypothetical protein